MNEKKKENPKKKKKEAHCNPSIFSLVNIKLATMFVHMTI
jgi:hypothetical protein